MVHADRQTNKQVHVHTHKHMHTHTHTQRERERERENIASNSNIKDSLKYFSNYCYCFISIVYR